ncbi:MAG: hypothetical protein NW206_13725 [Hyphomonadaceae bacterium]|nr:hypothetical protein [Hyphomonadaceae bacterium]
MKLRRPAWLYAPVAIMLLFLVALIGASLINTGVSDAAPVAARGLFMPAVIGLVLTLVALIPRVRRNQIASRMEIIRRAAIGFAVAGCVWPLSFGFAVALQGDFAGLLHALLPSVLGLFVGALVGGAGGAAAAYASFTWR